MAQYTDINLDFEPHPVTGDVVILKDANAIKRSLRNLVLTNFYEHPYDENIGTGIRAMLFENFDARAVTTAIKERVKFVIARYEPRVELIDVIVSEYPDDNALNIEIKFFAGSSIEPQEVSVMLERVR
jgi:phage baseplate assembly protein W